MFLKYPASKGAPRGIHCMVAIAMTAAGCQAGSRAGGSQVGPISTPSEGTHLQLPLDSYVPTYTQSAQQSQMVARLERACMKRFGFDFLPNLSNKVANSVRISLEFDSRRYGVSNPNSVKIYGYHLPDWVQGSASPQSINSLPADERLVLRGAPGNSPGTNSGSNRIYANQAIPPGGCSGEANRLARDSANGQATGRSNLVAELKAAGFQRTQIDSRVLLVFKKWSSCMKANGYVYTDPFKAMGDPRWDMNGSVSQAERQAASVDLSCKLKTNELGVEFAVESAYENSDIEKNAEALSQVKRDVASQMDRLEKLVRQYGA